jgi:hypothetical protein
VQVTAELGCNADIYIAAYNQTSTMETMTVISLSKKLEMIICKRKKNWLLSVSNLLTDATATHEAAKQK